MQSAAALLPLFLLLPGLALAGTPAATQFAAVIQDAGHHATVLAAAQASPAWLAAPCATASFNEAPEVGVYVPVLFNAAGQPVTGAWREGIIATGCQRSLTLNVLTQVTAAATLATGFLLPGSTIADPVLQNIAQKNAVQAAGGIQPGCKNPYIGDTEFSAYDSGANRAVATPPWSEIWTVDFCGASKRVTMHFAPDSSGTNISAAPES